MNKNKNHDSISSELTFDNLSHSETRLDGLDEFLRGCGLGKQPTFGSFFTVNCIPIIRRRGKRHEGKRNIRMNEEKKLLSREILSLCLCKTLFFLPVSVSIRIAIYIWMVDFVVSKWGFLAVVLQSARKYAVENGVFKVQTPNTWIKHELSFSSYKSKDSSSTQ